MTRPADRPRSPADSPNRAFRVGKQVLVESDLVSQTLDKEELDQACQAVGTITDHFGPLLAVQFGGKTFFADEKDE